MELSWLTVTIVVQGAIIAWLVKERFVAERKITFLRNELAMGQLAVNQLTGAVLEVIKDLQKTGSLEGWNITEIPAESLDPPSESGPSQ